MAVFSSSNGVRMLLAALTLATVSLISGCQEKPKPPPPPPAPPTQDAYTTLRQTYTQLDPSARVGSVVAVLSDKPYVAVGDVDVKSFKVGDAVSIVDSTEKVVANGIVKNIQDGLLAVEYTKASDARRTPQVGDVAVSFAKK